MASENETVMAVCAEWRACIESADSSVWNDERIAGLVKTTKAQQIAYLDRIEAAWNREKAEWEAAACACVSDAVMSGRVAVEHEPVCNAAARDEVVLRLSKEEYKGMQEALSEHDRLCEMLTESEMLTASMMSVGNAAAMREALREAIGETCAGCARDCDDCVNLKSGWMKKAKAALSAPARNCDRFTDAEAARQAWLDDTENWDEFGSPELELYEWLLAPAAERKGEGDGSK